MSATGGAENPGPEKPSTEPGGDGVLAGLPTTTPGPAEQYSAFLRWQKNCIIFLAALSGWFSSISSFIYFPVTPFLAADLGVSTQGVNLTVTSYLVMSGIFPSTMGDAADRFGRRPVLILALAIYLGANVGLALQSHFAPLFVPRMLQSAGISGTFSIAYGVLGDLFAPAERGGYSGVVASLWAPALVHPLDNSFAAAGGANEAVGRQSEYSSKYRARPKRSSALAMELEVHFLVSHNLRGLGPRDHDRVPA